MCENPTKSVPNWLNEPFLQETLRNHFKNDEINVINYNVRVVTAKGGNKIYQIIVSFGVALEGEANCHLVVKEASSDAHSSYASSKEIPFYEEIVSKFNDKLDDVGEPELFPEVFGVCKEKNLLIFGDLSSKGYQVLNRGYSIPEAKSILKRMAVFHAVSAVLQEEDPNIFVNFNSGRLSRKANEFDTIYSENLKVISEWTDADIYTEKLRRLTKDEIIERAHRAYDLNPSHFNTLNHDGFLREHIMVRTENPSEGNIVLISFQHPYWGSPTIDLQVFLNTSIDEAFRPQHFGELVHFYYENLVDFLQQLNYKNQIPTWTEFENQFYERNILGFIASCLFDVNKTTILDEKYETNLRKLISHYNQLGSFD